MGSGKIVNAGAGKPMIAKENVYERIEKIFFFS